MSLAFAGRGRVACALLIAVSFTTTAAGASAERGYHSAVVVAADTGQTLVEQDADAQWEPASLVKMMLSLVARERAVTTAFHMLTPVRTSAYASKMGGSQVYLKHGEVFTLSSMLQAMEIASANDASVAVAEAIAGSTDATVDLMNFRARELGMAATTFVNVHGLPTAPGEAGNVTTARDMATLARALLTEHPGILLTGSTKTAPFRGGEFILYNTNKQFLQAFDGADGLKTGYHKAAKYNIAATAQREDMRLIAVVLGADSGDKRTRGVSRLLDSAFATYKRDTVVDAGERLPDQVYVEG
ncbi:D-alanyl-D-alanine carboxypeptidase, partial [Candidatus Poribacteria bacterium]|nr:D-alanyl-D-alanine carboxypeptidase [Candidatus Poribacteria bacterium]